MWNIRILNLLYDTTQFPLSPPLPTENHCCHQILRNNGLSKLSAYIKKKASVFLTQIVRKSCQLAQSYPWVLLFSHSLHPEGSLCLFQKVGRGLPSWSASTSHPFPQCTFSAYVLQLTLCTSVPTSVLRVESSGVERMSVLLWRSMGEPQKDHQPSTFHCSMLVLIFFFLPFEGKLRNNHLYTHIYTHMYISNSNKMNIFRLSFHPLLEPPTNNVLYEPMFSFYR